MSFDSVFKAEDKAYKKPNLQTICTAYLLGYLLASRLVHLGEKPPARLHFAQARLLAVWMGSGFPCLVSCFLAWLCAGVWQR